MNIPRIQIPAIITGSIVGASIALFVLTTSAEAVRTSHLASPSIHESVDVNSDSFRESAEANSDSFRASLDYARERVYPALVNIAVVARYFEGGRAERSPAGGSGVIISPNGYVLTNFHVAGHTTMITCTTSDGDAYPAKVVGQDPLSDLSVLKLVIPKGHPPLRYAELGDSDKMQVGDSVLAMGNPLMLSSSMTLGIISNTKRVFTDFMGTEIQNRTLETGELTGVFTRWIQHDALILPGNSGGPLVNLQGQVIGINELGGNGFGFAIPSNIAKNVFQQIVHHGSVRRGWLGLDIEPVQKIGLTTGALVSSVLPGSPADKVGIKPGEIVESIDGKPTDVEFFEQVPLFYQQIAALPKGHVARITLESGKSTVVVRPVVALMPPDVGDEEDFATAGVTARNITDEMAIEMYLPNHDGVLVTGVRSGYPFDSATPSIEEGDVITSIAGLPVTDMSAFRKDLTQALAGSQPGDKQLVAFRRNDEELLSTVVLHPQESDNSDAELPQAWIGIRTQVLDSDIAAAIGQPNLEGFRVTEIYPYTNASKSSLKVGDIITKIDDNELDASREQDSDDFRQAVQALNVGDTATLSVFRDGTNITVPVKLEAEPDDSSQSKSVTQKELEFSVRTINNLDRFENHWLPSQKGLLVTDATTGGYAMIAGLNVNDLIVSIDGTPVSTVADLKSILGAAVKTHPTSIEVFVRRGASTQFVFIQPDWSKLTAFTEQ